MMEGKEEEKTISEDSIMETSGIVKEKMMEGKEEEKTISEDSIKDPQ
jgi:hypothetical protein